MGFFSFFKSKPTDTLAYARHLLDEGKYQEAKTAVLNVDGDEAQALYAEAERLQRHYETAQAFVRPSGQAPQAVLNGMMRRPALVRCFKHIMEQERPDPGQGASPPSPAELAPALERVQRRFFKEFHALCAAELAAAGIAANAHIEPSQVAAVESAVAQAEQRFLAQLGLSAEAAAAR